MQYEATNAIVFRGDHIRRGAVVEMTAEEAELFDPADISLVSDAPAEEPEEEKELLPLEEMAAAQLRERAKELGLKASGSVADLRERIALHLEGQADEPEEENDITSE